MLTGHNSSLHTYPKKKSVNFLPSSAPPQEDKYKFPLYSKRPKKLNPPTSFPTSFQIHEKHQFISSLHQPTQRIQPSIFLHFLRVAPPLPLRSCNALFEGQWSGLCHERLTQEQNPSSFGQINCISLLCSCPHSLLSLSRRPAMELRWGKKIPAFEHLKMDGKQKTLNKNTLYSTRRSKYFSQVEEFTIINPLQLNKPKYLRVKPPSTGGCYAETASEKKHRIWPPWIRDAQAGSCLELPVLCLMGWENPCGSSLDGVLTGWKSLLKGEGTQTAFEETL